MKTALLLIALILAAQFFFTVMFFTDITSRMENRMVLEIRPIALEALE